MRNKFAEVFFQLASEDPKLCLIVADISPAGSIEKFRTTYPERFINTGVAEQIMIGMAAGLCQSGMKPFAYTIGTFALYRPFEFIRNDLAYQNLPVTVIGIGGGLAYSTLGATHHSHEDMAVACAIPNLSVIAPCDPLETEAAVRFCAVNKSGPIYLRLGKAGEPNLTEYSVNDWSFGKLHYIRSGSQYCIISYGPITHLALSVAQELKRDGINASVVSCHTLKPLDLAGIGTILSIYDKVIVIEEMTEIYGLGARIKALSADFRKSAKVYSFGLNDKFTHIYGTQKELLSYHKLTIANIMEKIS